MKIVYSLTELPSAPLFMYSVVDKAEAEKIATQYSSAWLYKGKMLFVLNSEKEKL